ncbi:MAG: hypothetical protein K6T29_03465 [Peptococcaceae bacterium]|nr:hypothetical protein [Peptococcaceae bacterium]
MLTRLTELNNFLRPAREFLLSPGTPHDAAKLVKEAMQTFFPGFDVYILAAEKAGPEQFLAADYRMPSHWLERMTEVYGGAALIDPHKIQDDGEKCFAAPFLWLSIHFAGETYGVLLFIPGGATALPGREEIRTAGDLASVVGAVIRSRLLPPEKRTAAQKEAEAQKEAICSQSLAVRELDRAVREPLNTVIGLSLLLLDGTVAGPLTKEQQGMAREILDGGYAILKEIEKYGGDSF